MNSRERVLATLEHRKPDRIPLDFGSTLVTGITRNAYLRLKRHLGEERGTFEFHDVIQQLALVEESVLERLEVDTRGLMPNTVRKAPRVEDRGTYRSFTDEWGVEWKMPADGLYFDLVKSPLDGDITVQNVEDFPWPSPTDDALFEGLQERAKRWHQQGYAVILESICAGILEMSQRVRGYEQFYMDLALNPELACRLLDKFVEIKLQFYERAAQTLGGYVQFIREGDDLAGEESLLISPRAYRQYIKPRHAKLFEAQRELFPEPFFVFFHSDGAISPVIPDLIELGVDVLNPVQLSAKGMNAGRLKREFGRNIAFWGGAMDPQALATSSQVEVKRTVGSRIDALAPDGGYIFGSIHNIQDDVPPQNILAMWEALRERTAYA